MGLPEKKESPFAAELVCFGVSLIPHLAVNCRERLRVLGALGLRSSG